MILISQKEINLSVNQCTTVIADLICVQLHLRFYISIKSPIGRKFEYLCEKGVKKSMKNTCWKAGTITYRHRYTPVCPCVRTQTHAKCSVTSACTDWHCTEKSKPNPCQHPSCVLSVTAGPLLKSPWVTHPSVCVWRAVEPSKMPEPLAGVHCGEAAQAGSTERRSWRTAVHRLGNHRAAARAARHPPGEELPWMLWCHFFGCGIPLLRVATSFR